MSTRIDLTGQRFGRLVVVEFVDKANSGHAIWRCKCDCGGESFSLSCNLKKGTVKSCGCYKKERITETASTHGEADKNPEYYTWLALKNRCKNPSHVAYNYYGGRGISVCDRWVNSYQNFIIDMGRKPSPKHSIDRIDSDGDYEPSNCRWATSKEQALNKR